VSRAPEERWTEHQLYQLAASLELGHPAPEELAGLARRIRTDAELAQRVLGIRSWLRAMRRVASRQETGGATPIVLMLRRNNGLEVTTPTPGATRRRVVEAAQAGSTRELEIIRVERDTAWLEVRLELSAAGLRVSLRTRGSPLPDMEVHLTDRDGESIAIARTDAFGVARLPEPPREARLVSFWPVQEVREI
jgi:hypothetical protein